MAIFSWARADEARLESRKKARRAKQTNFLKSESDWENKVVVYSFGESGGGYCYMLEFVTIVERQQVKSDCSRKPPEPFLKL